MVGLSVESAVCHTVSVSHYKVKIIELLTPLPPPVTTSSPHRIITYLTRPGLFLFLNCLQATGDRLQLDGLRRDGWREDGWRGDGWRRDGCQGDGCRGDGATQHVGVILD